MYRNFELTRQANYSNVRHSPKHLDDEIPWQTQLSCVNERSANRSCARRAAPPVKPRVPRGDYFVIYITNHLQFLFDDVRLRILGRCAGKSKLPNGRRPRHHVITLITSQFISVSHFEKSERYIMSVFHISYYIIPTTKSHRLPNIASLFV